MELAKLTNLTTLDLGANDLVGEIPVELGQANQSEIRLDLSSQQVDWRHTDGTGCISLPSKPRPLLQTSCTGKIPEELDGLTNLEYLGLENNQL